MQELHRLLSLSESHFLQAPSVYRWGSFHIRTQQPSAAQSGARRILGIYGFPKQRRPRFWAAFQLPKALLQSALLGFQFSGGKLPQLESRREKAGDSGRNGRNRHGEAMGASPGLTGKAETAAPQRSPPFPAGPTGAPRGRLVTEAGTRTGLWGESDPD